jgi:predicted dehydrogenase
MQVPEAHVVGMADPDERLRQSLTSAFGIKSSVADYRHLLDDKTIDLIYVCTPHWLHRKITVDALLAGKHVVCEKPIATTLSDAEDMIQSARKAARKLFVAHNHRFVPANQKVMQLIRGGAIGAPFLALAGFIGNEYERMSDPVSWKGTFDRAGGGVLIDSGTHMLDILRWFLGEVEAVTAVCKRLVVTAPKAEDCASAILEFEGGALAELTVTFAARYSPWPKDYGGAAIHSEVLGTKGAIYTDIDPRSQLILVSEGKRVELPQDELETGLPSNVSAHFVDCILNDKQPIVTAEDGLEALRIALACYESAKHGTRVEIVPPGETVSDAGIRDREKVSAS